MQVTVLVENSSGCDLTPEHGLSLFITYRNQYYLLDSGSSDLFLENAKKLSIPLDQVSAAFLSHGHFDHANGFPTFLKACPNVPLYAHRGFDREYEFVIRTKREYIGVPEELKHDFHDRIHLINSVTQVASGIWLVPHSTPGLEKIGERTKLFYKEADKFIPDDFSHEMSLVFELPQGLAIFNSCSHGGLLHILDEVQAAFPGKKLYAFVGGLHMKGSRHGQETSLYSWEELAELAENLKKYPLTAIYTGHCTGSVAFGMLKELLGDEIRGISTGMTFEL